MKGDFSVNDYLDQMNASADNLPLAGKLVNDDELVHIIMNNLCPTYDIIVSAVQAHDTPITYDTLEALLLMVEHQMVEQVVPMPKNGPSAFVAACGHSGFHPRNFGRGDASPTREGFLNQQGGSSRGIFFQLNVLPILGSLQHRLLQELFARYVASLAIQLSIVSSI
ncbi:unnamed protein product [Prunus armeniaca]